MPATKKLLALLSLAALAAALLAGCGGGSSGGGGGEPASLAPQSAPVFFEADLAPGGQTSEELDQLADTVLGIEDVSEFIAEKLDGAVTVGNGTKFDYESEVEPWVGEKAGLFLLEYDGNNFHGGGIALETSNVGEAEEFFEAKNEEAPHPIEAEEFEGDKFWVSSEDESVLGFIGDYFVYGETQADFEAMVTAAENDEGLNEAEKFQQATESAPDDGVGNLYVDIGGLFEQAKGSLDAEAEAGLALLGIEPKDATAVATVIPHAEQVELDLSTNVSRAAESGGDASALLESLPATAVIGFAEPEFGKAFGEALHEFSEKGVPGQLEPGELESAFGQLGLNVESLSGSLGAIAGFVEGSSRSSLSGAVVLETSGAGEAKQLVGNLGLLLRATGTAGVTAISGELSGFSVSLNGAEQPLVVGASGEKIVISYGARAAAQALRKQAKTLGTTADFEAAKSALGSTPINAFLAAGPALKLIKTLVPATESEGFTEAEPYLRKITYAALGSEAKDGVTTSKVIVGVQK